MIIRCIRALCSSSLRLTLRARLFSFERLEAVPVPMPDGCPHPQDMDMQPGSRSIRGPRPPTPRSFQAGHIAVPHCRQKPYHRCFSHPERSTYSTVPGDGYHKMEKRHRDGKLKTPRAGTPWVHVQNAIQLGVSRPVRMSADDHVEPGCFDVQLSNVMEDVDQAGTGLGDRRHRQVGRAQLMVAVGRSLIAPLPHGRGSSGTLTTTGAISRNFGLANIAGVDDEIGTF